MDWSDIAPLALQVLSPVLAAAMARLSAKLAALIRSKTENAHLQGSLLRLHEAVIGPSTSRSASGRRRLGRAR